MNNKKNLKFTSIKPGLIFEYNGVKLESVKKEEGCECCFFAENHLECSSFPCFERYTSDQKHNIIFKEVKA